LAKVERTDAAEDDLLEIWTYIASDDPAAADRHLDHIDSACKLLGRSPLLGRAATSWLPGCAVFRWEIT
jgi:toxin ParE1/3/4